MKYSLIFIILVIFGCGGCTSGGSAQRSLEELYPVVAGTISFKLGDSREIVAPPGSATAGSKWLETTVTYTNTSDQPVWVCGYSKTYPFHGIETRVDSGAVWVNPGHGYCATGARFFEILPGDSYQFQTALPKRYTGQEFRVSLEYRTTPDNAQWLKAVSEARRLSPPSAG